MAQLSQLYDKGIQVLEEAGIEEARHDAWVLLSHIIGISRAQYYLEPDKSIEDKKAEAYEKALKKRSTRLPVQYITGVQEFMGLDFAVSKAVLIPRQDTELLVEKVMELFVSKKLDDNASVLDMCTGSGCIAISLAVIMQLEQVTAVDKSTEALKIATKNAKKNQVSHIQFIESNMFKKVTGLYDVIVSNPPYIKSQVIEGLMPEVKDYEPRMALDGEADGLYFYRHITEQSKIHLNDGGYLLYEIGYDQGKEVSYILEQNGFTEIEVFQDLAGLDRVVKARWN